MTTNTPENSGAAGVPNVTEGAVSGFGDEQLTPRQGQPASTLVGSAKFEDAASVDTLGEASDVTQPSVGDQPSDTSPPEDSAQASPGGDNSVDGPADPTPVALSEGGSPLDFNVDEINEYLGTLADDEAGQAERNRVLDAELARSDGTDPRVSINGLERT